VLTALRREDAVRKASVQDLSARDTDLSSCISSEIEALLHLRVDDFSRFEAASRPSAHPGQNSACCKAWLVRRAHFLRARWAGSLWAVPEQRRTRAWRSMPISRTSSDTAEPRHHPPIPKPRSIRPHFLR